MDNYAFAATDFLVVIGAVFGIWRIWPWRRKGPARFVRLGLAFMALAALVGTLRFATGQVEGGAALHGLMSEFAGSAGLLLIALGPTLQAWPDRVPPALSRYLRIGLPVVVAFLMLWPGTGAIVMILPTLALLIGFGASAGLLLQRRWVTGGLWLASWSLLLVASLGVGTSRETAMFGIVDWHVYHLLMALWTIAVGEAMRRTMEGRAHI